MSLAFPTAAVEEHTASQNLILFPPELIHGGKKWFLESCLLTPMGLA